jgi:hypothetical protein
MNKLASPFLALAVLAGSAQANLLSNGSFDAGAFAGGSFGYPLAMQLGSGSGTITGWTVGGELAWFTAGQADLTPQDGAFAVDLTGFCDLGNNGAGPCLGTVPAGGYGTISQTVSTVVGATYHLDFQGGTYGYNGSAPTLVVSAAGTSSSYLLPSGAPLSGNWTAYGFDFTATGTSTQVSFGGSGGGNTTTYYLGVDNAVLELVSLPVPEPGRGALLLLGLVLPWAVARRRLR